MAKTEPNAGQVVYSQEFQDSKVQPSILKQAGCWCAIVFDALAMKTQSGSCG
jgi:hypothetical protein